MTQSDVRAFYDAFGEREWVRLAQPADGALEFAVTCHTLAKCLPTAGRVLDLGGGPGRYTLWLAEHGYRVVLADLSPALLEIARDKVAQSHVAGQVEEIVEADARNLSRWPDSAVDAVLALGPFYHLPDPADQARAAAELARVLRPGGVTFIALVPRYAPLRRVIAVADERHHVVQEGFVERLLEEGVFINEVPGRFTGVSGVRPQEVAPFFESHGFTSHDLLACESVIPDLQEELAQIGEQDAEAYQQVLEGLIRIAGDPNILRMSTHLLYVASKKP